MMKHRILLGLSLAFSLSLPGLAHEDRHGKDIKTCHCSGDNHDHDDHLFTPDHDYTKAFKEGTLNLNSAHTFDADNLYLAFSHNYLVAGFPHGSNPAFLASYVPFEHFQIDTLLSLRKPPTTDTNQNPFYETELGVKYQVLDEYAGDWLSLAPRLAFNTRGNVFGGEVSATKFIFLDRWQVGLGYRFLSNASADSYDRAVNAISANTLVRVWKHWHLFGDVSVPLDGQILQERSVVWSTGIKKRVPHSPHTLVLYVGNTQENSISGRTIASGADLANHLRVGFYFSIDIPKASRLPERLFLL